MLSPPPAELLPRFAVVPPGHPHSFGAVQDAGGRIVARVIGQAAHSRLPWLLARSPFHLQAITDLVPFARTHRSAIERDTWRQAESAALAQLIQTTDDLIRSSLGRPEAISYRQAPTELISGCRLRVVESATDITLRSPAGVVVAQVVQENRDLAHLFAAAPALPVALSHLIAIAAGWVAQIGPDFPLRRRALEMISSAASTLAITDALAAPCRPRRDEISKERRERHLVV